MPENPFSVVRRLPVTGFDRIQGDILATFVQRRDGWPVGPEMVTGAGFYVTTPTVQIVEQHARRYFRKRFVVHTFFPFRRLDQRFPPSDPMTLEHARRYAIARLHELAFPERAEEARGPGIDWWKGGRHIGMEVLR